MCETYLQTFFKMQTSLVPWELRALVVSSSSLCFEPVYKPKSFGGKEESTTVEQYD